MALPKIPTVYLGSSGLKVSVLCLGTMNFGRPGVPTQCADEATAFAIMDAYAAAGGNFIDTADIYAGGESEIVVGKWLALRKADRHKFILATKARFSSDPAAGPNDVGLSRHHLMKSVNDSLARLGVDYIDLFQCHAWDAGTPLEETLRALDDLVKAGKIHYVGAHAGCASARAHRSCDVFPPPVRRLVQRDGMAAAEDRPRVAPARPRAVREPPGAVLAAVPPDR